jgi:hypothetical protein
MPNVGWLAEDQRGWRGAVNGFLFSNVIIIIIIIIIIQQHHY